MYTSPDLLVAVVVHRDCIRHYTAVQNIEVRTVAGAQYMYFADSFGL